MTIERSGLVQSLDFPSLIADGGEPLYTELGIKSKLHREQIVRAVKRLLLGLGDLPSKPQVKVLLIKPFKSCTLLKLIVSNSRKEYAYVE